MSFFRRFFGQTIGPSKGPPSPTPEQQVGELERRAEGAPLGTKGTLLNRAGDVFMRAGNHQKALYYFRRAIDLLLEDEQPEPARGVAKKIIRVHPDTVRTHCTLTWLDLANQHPGTARKSLREYFACVEKRGLADEAGPQILEMAKVTTHKGFLEEASEILEKLGFGERAELVEAWAMDGGAALAQKNPEKLSKHCLEAAIASEGSERG